MSKPTKNKPTSEMLAAGGNDAGVLERFMKEFFPYRELKKAGVFTKEMRGDYYSQAVRICNRFGYKSVFEYGSKEIRCHISYVQRPPGTPFVEVIPNIYE